MSLKEAKEKFKALFASVDKKNKVKFIDFVYEQLVSCNNLGEPYEDEDSEKHEGLLDDPISTLNNIAEEIKKKVPVSAILSSEKISPPKTGQNADCLSDITVHVDEFLYDDDDIEDLAEDGKLKRNYCMDCGSKNIEPLIFISHSMSRKSVYYVFNDCLPTLENKIVLDVGSRLGVVLYGAYVLTDASQIIGVEMNEDLCKLQREIIEKYKMQDRIEVMCKKIEESDDVVKSADVIVINNAFEFYVTDEKQVEIWQFLKSNIKSKCILVTRPHLETTFENLDTGINLKTWVKPYRLNGEEIATSNEEEFCDLNFYEIL
ncbi:uncharacterized protein LOC131674805 [Phymastichus coffea]|uniref:uncharacterized protein LOC131670324 n=1 Tax=Phymastichus coffea TaxID=108790 RepID=UPI00273B02FA|nr:uncharacterized protein LOC131670324 [Phymastichus coffea]XP_058809618.1 uncharacterized protein LOC131674805 [Phymastichus coffea]